jgi:hypothetical protein
MIIYGDELLKEMLHTLSSFATTKMKQAVRGTPVYHAKLTSLPLVYQISCSKLFFFVLIDVANIKDKACTLWSSATTKNETSNSISVAVGQIL